ncbi:MarR family winged helix-turn-helix transcriptional regulator [Glaciibacter sp. 2TAF33]|uniref:MarR family winged helix-turn-helix transcriptional regulator n=1 Tax=Glaciibacter sp. 2TAF33 TaxID=3233015 RepID=UPI003F936682
MGIDPEVHGDLPDELQPYSGFLIRRAQQLHLDVWADGSFNGITGIQFGVLVLVERHPLLDQKTLGAHLALDRSTIAGIVSRLERQGLITRSVGDADARRRLLELTPAGADALVELRRHAALVDQRLTAPLSEPERLELRRLLGVLITHHTAPAAGESESLRE